MSRDDENEAKKFEKLFEKSVETWLNKKYAQFGRWTLGLIGVAVFMGILQMIAWFNGYQKVPDNIQSLRDVKAETKH